MGDQGPLDRFIGPPVEEWVVELLPNGSEDERAALARDYRACYDREGWRNNSVFPGVREMLVDLRRQGFPLYVCTSKQQHFAVRILDAFELSGLFTAIYGDKAGIRKPQQSRPARQHPAERTRSIPLGSPPALHAPLSMDDRRPQLRHRRRPRKRPPLPRRRLGLRLARRSAPRPTPSPPPPPMSPPSSPPANPALPRHHFSSSSRQSARQDLQCSSYGPRWNKTPSTAALRPPARALRIFSIPPRTESPPKPLWKTGNF